MKIKILFLSVLCFFTTSFFADCITEIEDLSTLKILSPDLECRKSAKLRLKNGLEVLLISDEKADKSAAALSVGVGFWEDPKMYPGLAHFTEHMLFQGSKAYPGEDDFMRFIDDHGGSSNANTSFKRTVYFFSINHSSFKEGLDRFSHFFIDPLFRFNNVKREMQAVDQEYLLYLEDDMDRVFSVEQATANQDHPFSRFFCGNSESLAKVTQDVLKKWFAENYSSDIMHLVVYSPLPLDALKELIVEKFEQIPNKNFKQNEDTSTPIYTKESGGNITFIEPISDTDELTLLWEIPYDNENIGELVAYALEHGEKNLLAHLKKEGLATNLIVSPSKLSKKSALFEIIFALTKTGVKNYKEVIKAAFEALELLKKESIPEYLNDEIKTMSTLAYQYQERKNPSNFVMEMAVDLKLEDLSTYPNKTFLPPAYDKERIKEFVNSLTPRNCHFYLLTLPENIHMTYDKKVKWSNTAYRIKPLDKNILSLVEKVTPNSEIKFSEPNRFIPTSVQLVDHYIKEGSLENPINMDMKDKGVCYFIKDGKSPFVSYKLHIKSPIFNSTFNPSLLNIYLGRIWYNLNPLLEEGRAAGISTYIYYENYSIVLSVHGYSDTIYNFIQKLLEGIKSLRPMSSGSFYLTKDSVISEYSGATLDIPLVQAEDYLTNFITSQPTREENIEFLTSLTFEDYSLFEKNLFASTFVFGNLCGNLNPNEGFELFKLTQNCLNSSPYPLKFHEKIRKFSLMDHGPYKIKVNSNALGNGVILLIELGNYSEKLSACQKVLSQAINEAFFTALRTEQKTCYVAQSYAINKEGKLFLLFEVQSGTHEADELLFRFEIFLDAFSDNLFSKINEERFESLKQNILIHWQTPPKNINELSELLDFLAVTKKGDFNFLNSRIRGLSSLSYEEFLSTISPLLSRENKKRLAVIVAGKVSDDKKFYYTDVDKENRRDFCIYQCIRRLIGSRTLFR